jgi:hypothetical protein
VFHTWIPWSSWVQAECSSRVCCSQRARHRSRKPTRETPHNPRADKSRDAVVLIDGGAAMFFWRDHRRWSSIQRPPRTAPLLFDPSEGGLESRKGGEIPGVALTAGGVAVIGGMVLGDDPSRYYHAKGMAESLANRSGSSAGKTSRAPREPKLTRTSRSTDRSM